MNENPELKLGEMIRKDELIPKNVLESNSRMSTFRLPDINSLNNSML